MTNKLKTKKIGLALGGGAVLGAAHIGVLKALEDYRIKVSYISGTSIGAFAATFHAFNLKWKAIEKIALKLKWMDISRLSLSRFGLMTNDKLGKLITENIGDKNIEESEIPLAIIATNITNGKKVVLCKGKVADAVMASMCIPGIFIPVNIGNLMLVDGGIVENVPITPLKDMGADYIISVNLNAKHANQKPENIVDVILNSFHYTIQASTVLQTKDVDISIQPDLSSFNRTDTGQIEALIEKGYRAAMEQLKKFD